MPIIPLSLYIHFPWCLRKCPYCDFNSYPLPSSQEQSRVAYTDKLLFDLENEAKNAVDRQLSSIYFGGGTPSLLPPNEIRKIINRVKNLFDLAPDIEITLEANPGAINLEACEGFKDAGVDRISLGVQSFNDDKLKRIGRIHTAEQAQEAINAIKQTKFASFNLDIMFGLPGQNVDAAMSDLQTTLSFSPPHLSWYQLTLEPKTSFAANPPILPANEELWDIQQAGQKLLEQSGLLQYEVSAYSKPGCECRHNVNYWQYGDYLGIGAGAHGKITLGSGEVRRYWKISGPNEYLQAQDSLIDGEKTVAPKDIPFEFMLNALRLYRPISYALFRECTGVTIDAIIKELRHAQNLGLIELQKDSIITTIKGKNFLNDLLEIFL
jgi:putative oxygen-independent coproporphyrinogen III oxidase